jgi:hypothetical protein
MQTRLLGRPAHPNRLSPLGRRVSSPRVPIAHSYNQSHNGTSNHETNDYTLGNQTPETSVLPRIISHSPNSPVETISIMIHHDNETASRIGRRKGITMTRIEIGTTTTDRKGTIIDRTLATKIAHPMTIGSHNTRNVALRIPADTNLSTTQIGSRK